MSKHDADDDDDVDVNINTDLGSLSHWVLEAAPRFLQLVGSQGTQGRPTDPLFRRSKLNLYLYKVLNQIGIPE